MTSTFSSPTVEWPATPQLEGAWMRWRVNVPEQPERLSVAELAECCCPDLCDRDHANE